MPLCWSSLQPCLYISCPLMQGVRCVQCTAGLIYLVPLQCYVHQLRQIRHDEQQSGHHPQPGHPFGPSKSGDADWSLLSPRGDQSNPDPSLALPLRRLHAHSTLHSVATATTKVRFGPQAAKGHIKGKCTRLPSVCATCLLITAMPLEGMTAASMCRCCL